MYCEWWRAENVNHVKHIYIYTENLNIEKEFPDCVYGWYYKKVKGKQKGVFVPELFALNLLVEENSKEHKALIKKLGLSEHNRRKERRERKTDN